MIPSKADRILSRYRPIAPKPATATAVVALLSPPPPNPTPFKKPSLSSSASSGRSKRARRSRENNERSGRSSDGAVREAENMLLPFTSGLETLTMESSRSGTLTDLSGVESRMAHSRVAGTSEHSGFAARDCAAAAGSLTQSETPTEHSYGVAVARWDWDCDGICTRGVEPVAAPITTLSLLRDEAPSHSGTSTCSSSSTPVHPLPDLELLKQMYGASSEPVLLGDDSSGQILWHNPAYSRASTTSQTNGMAAPYIDPLGLRTPLTHFTSGSTTMTLWGFLRKLIFIDRDTTPTTPTTLRGSSIVTLESITQVHYSHPPYSPLLNTLAQQAQDIMKAQVEQYPCPAFASVPSNTGYRVQWTNTAFRKMVGGQPLSELCTIGHRAELGRCTTTTSSSSSGSSNAISSDHSLPSRVVSEGVVSFFCSPNVVIPRTAVAFSGRVNIQWTKSRSNGGRETSSFMIAPCDVVRIQNPDMLIWNFDVATSLSLSSCT